MKRLLLAVLVVTLCVTVVACGASEQTPTTRSTSATSQGTTTSSTATTLTTTSQHTTATNAVVSDPTSGSERRTVSQPFANKEVGTLLAKIPWTTAPSASFYAEVAYDRGSLYEVFFSTDTYDFIRGYMASTTFVLNDGSRYTQKELQNLVDNGTITPDELMAVFSLMPRPKMVVDVSTKENLFGEMISYRRSREATVKQGHAEVHIYPPFDFFGEFFKDDRRTDSVGYCVNAAYLEQIIQAVCPSAGTLDTAEAIRVGDSLFVPLSAAEKLGITVNVGERSEESPSSTPSLQIVLPNA